MPIQVLVNTSPGEIRVAVWANGQLVDYELWRPGAPDGVGDVHCGQISARMPALGGAFVRLANSLPGFLPDTEGAEGLNVGTKVQVEVTRAAQNGKGPRLTARMASINCSESEGRPKGSVRLIRRGPDALMRLATRYSEAEVLIDDPACAAAYRGFLGPRLRLEKNAWNDAVENAVAGLADAEVLLENGARLTFTPTPALVAIDVDAGASSVVRERKNPSQLALNRAILPELVRQIRLRNLGGAILVDFAGLSRRGREALRHDLVKSLSDDPVHPRLLGFSGLGLAEILRPRIHPPLHELLGGPHAAGLEALRYLEKALTASPTQVGATLRVSLPVLTALERDRPALKTFQEKLGVAPRLMLDATLSACEWRL